MADITSTTTPKVIAALAGVNIAILQTPDSTDQGDTINLNTVIDANGGERVKQILFATATQSPNASPAVAEPVRYTDSGTPTLTIGGVDNDKRRDILVHYK